MKRYEIYAIECDCCGPGVEEQEDSTGTWVKYEDAAAEIAKLQVELAEAQRSGRLDIVGGEDQGRINSKVYYR